MEENVLLNNSSVILVNNGEKVLSKKKIMEIVESIDYEKLFELLWNETFCRYKYSMYAMLNLQTGKIECNDFFLAGDRYSYLIIRELNLTEIEIKNIFNEDLNNQYLNSGIELEEFFKFKRIDDKEVFKQYYVENWKSSAWYWDILSEENLENAFTERKKIGDL
jgi:hypothetical protein